jgi:Zn-dependent protease with chaperone function
MDARGLTLDQTVYGGERVLFVVMVVVSLLIYAGLGLLVYATPSTGGVILFYGLLFVLAGFVAHAFALGRIQGNGVLVSERQLPLVHQLLTHHAQRLGLPYVPVAYVLESGGILNAFATKLLGRKFVIVNADVVALAVRRSRAALSFVVAHELGHHWRGHLKWRWLITPARLLPYLGTAYSRACEYTCDRVGAYCEPEGAIDGLLVLAAGSWLHTHVNPQEFARQAEIDQGFWVRRAEWLSTHPRLPKRVAALLALGVHSPMTEPLTEGTATA